MPDRCTLKPALPSSTDYPELELVLAEHLARYAHRLIGCGGMHEAQDAIREAGAAQLRAQKGSSERARSEVAADDQKQ